MKSYKLAALAAAVAGSLSGVATFAQTFTYNPNDLILGFRTASSTNNLVVDIGAASQYIGAAGPVVISGTYFTDSQLSTAFGTTNGIYFSVFGDVRTTGSPYGALNTLWLTAPRSDLNTPASPWSTGSSSQQGNVGGRIDAMANGAVTYGILNPSSSTLTTAIMPASYSFPSAISYSVGMGVNGNFAGTFAGGNVEGLTPVDFTPGGSTIAIDLFELDPHTIGGSGTGTLLGDFVFSPDGVLVFNPVPEPTTWATFATGMLALAVVRRFRNQK